MDGDKRKQSPALSTLHKNLPNESKDRTGRDAASLAKDNSNPLPSSKQPHGTRSEVQSGCVEQILSKNGPKSPASVVGLMALDEASSLGKNPLRGDAEGPSEALSGKELSSTSQVSRSLSC